MSENTRNNDDYSKRGSSSGWKPAGRKNRNSKNNAGKWQRNNRDESQRTERRWGKRDNDNNEKRWQKNEDRSGRRENKWHNDRSENYRGATRRRAEYREDSYQRSNERNGSNNRKYRDEDRQYQHRDTRNFQKRKYRDNDSGRERGHRGGERFGENSRDIRDRRNELINEIPESITAESLDASTRAHLRNLNRENSEIVARHLAYAGEMLDIDPEVAYRHAKAAFGRAARIDVVREALGITAYVTGRYQEALSELRTYRRMSSDFTHVPMEADAERGIGRSEKALRFIAEIPLAKLNPEAKIELALVTSGARADLGDSEGGLAVVERILVENLTPELAARVELVRADRLAELGREAEANALREKWDPIFEGKPEDAALVLDLEEVFADEKETSQSQENTEIDEAAFAELFDENENIEADSDIAVSEVENIDAKTPPDAKTLAENPEDNETTEDADLAEAEIDWEAEIVD